MAVNLLGSSNARVDFGDIAGIGGATALTIAFTLRPTVALPASGGRIVTQWGNGASEPAFLVGATDTDEIAIVVSNGVGAFYGKKTTGLNMVDGTTYRVVTKVNPPSNVGAIWVNGAAEAIDVFLASNNLTILNSIRSVQVGHETDEAVDGVDADYSEVAIWPEYVPDWFCGAYGRGFAPSFYRRNLIFYAPLINTSHLREVARGVLGTNTAGTDAAHPSMLYPRRVA